MSLPLPKGVKPAGHVDQDTLTQLGFSCDVETRPIPRKLEIDFVEVSMGGKSKSHQVSSGSNKQPICLDVDSKSSASSSCVSPTTMRIVRDRVELFWSTTKKSKMSPDSKSVTEFFRNQSENKPTRESDHNENDGLSSTLTQEPPEKGKDGWKSVFHDAIKASVANKAVLSSTQNAVVMKPSNHRDNVDFSSSSSVNTRTPEKTIEKKLGTLWSVIILFIYLIVY